MKYRRSGLSPSRETATSENCSCCGATSLLNVVGKRKGTCARLDCWPAGEETGAAGYGGAGQQARPDPLGDDEDRRKLPHRDVREGVRKPLLAARSVHKGDLQVRVWQAQRDVMNDTVATEDQEQPAGCHQRKARVADRDPGRRTSSGPADMTAQTGRTYLWTAPPFEGLLCSLAPRLSGRHLSGLFDPDGIRDTAPKHLTLFSSDMSVGLCHASVGQPICHQTSFTLADLICPSLDLIQRSMSITHTISRSCCQPFPPPSVPSLPPPHDPFLLLPHSRLLHHPITAW